MILKPQPGPQEKFLSSPADIAIFGGAAGGGKTYAMLLEPLRHAVTNPDFSAIFFRRTTPQIWSPGGLWDEASKMYRPLGAEARMEPPEWRFQNGGKIRFAHLQRDDNVYDWQGSQIPLIVFDELTHFTASQFWYLLSRNRSGSGVSGYIRASCNPDADSWVAELIAWWIDRTTGYPIKERAGVLRWFVRIDDRLEWADTRAELTEQFEGCEPKSLTFIPARLQDNKILTANDPSYLASLMAMTRVERERLLEGNWKIRPAAGLYFQRHWIEVVDAAPANLAICRGWDLAGTPATATNDPDWTCSVKMGRAADGTFYVLDASWLRDTPAKVQQAILSVASQDGHGVRISLPQDPGQAGKGQGLDYIKRLAGYRVQVTPEARNPGGDNAPPSRQSAKVTRFSPFSAQAEPGNVKVLRGPWNDRWFEELEAFPEARHDDVVDATSRAFTALITRAPMQINSEALARI